MTEPYQPMLRLFRYLRRYNTDLWRSVTYSVANKLFDLMPPFLTAWVIDAVSGHVSSWIKKVMPGADLWNIVLFLVALTIVIFGFESFFEWLYKKGFMSLAQKTQHDLRVDAYAHLQMREMAFFEEQRTGNLMAMLNDDINQLERFLNNSFNEILQMITLLIFAGWSLCNVSLPLGILGLTPIPFIIWGSIYYQRKIAPYYKEVREGVGRLGSRLENNITGIAVIKSFSAEAYEAKRLEDASAMYRDANFRAIRWNAVYVPLIRIPITFGFAGVLLVGAYWVLFKPGYFTLGSLAFFAMMIQRLLWPITQLGFVFDEYQRARAAARRVFGLLDTPTTISEPSAPKTLPGEVGQIELHNVCFSYKEGQPVLQGINLTIPRGHTIGIAGPTGGGKTTLVKLLLRFYDVSDGAITLEGIDIRELEIATLRRQFALVSQDVYLFHGTIRENIAYALDDCPQEVIEAAAIQAQLHDFIMGLPDGYDSIIGEKGIKLSGGQRQRLSIARAILKNAPILILDEATSAVDTETERAIQQSLNDLTRNKTAIIIAHRLSTIRHADNIIVIRDGKIAEEGDHASLVKHNGPFAELWRVQTGELLQ